MAKLLASFAANEPINCLAFAPTISPISLNEQLLAVGGEAQVTVLVVAHPLPREDDEEAELSCRSAMVFASGSRITSLDWSSLSIYDPTTTEYSFSLAAACANFQIITWTVKGQQGTQPTITSYYGHHNYINALAFSKDEMFATVSDDHTCRVWQVGKQLEISKIPLSSCGRSVAWHPRYPSKLMVAEENGAIHILDHISGQAFWTLHAGLQPLRFADLNTKDSFRFGAIAQQKWLTWNLKAASKQVTGPDETGDTPADGANIFRWSRHDPLVFAVTSPTGILRFHNIRSPNVPFNYKNPLNISDLSWHPGQPLCAVASDRYVYFWLAHF